LSNYAALGYDSIGHIRYASNKGEVGFGDSAMDWIASTSSGFSFFILPLFFYFYVFHRQKKVILSLLLISSTTLVFRNLLVMGRDGIVCWFLLFVFSYLHFKPLISKYDIKQIKKKLLLLFIFFIIIFLAISISRAVITNRDPFFFILDYIGQSFIYFSYFFNSFNEPSFYGRLVFPILFPLEERVSGQQMSDIMPIQTDFYLNTFGTFVGSFYFDIGAIYTLIFAILFCLVSLFIFRKKHLSFLKLQILIFCYVIIAFGVFYYYFIFPTFIKAVITWIFICGFLKFKININKKVINNNKMINDKKQE
jgi:oligosaccharide repeat unit polymerase